MAPAELPVPGQTIRNKYELIEQLGRGGMGAVFRARNLIWKEPKAIKVLQNTDPEGAMTKCFLAEDWIMRQLKHVNIVQVEDCDYDEQGRLFIAMELVEGEDLSKRLKRMGAIPEVEALWITIQACTALNATHSRGIIHRDIKPQNILLAAGPNGKDTVTDWLPDAPQADVIAPAISRWRSARSRSRPVRNVETEVL